MSQWSAAVVPVQFSANIATKPLYKTQERKAVATPNLLLLGEAAAAWGALKGRHYTLLIMGVVALQTIAAYLRVHLGRLDKKLEKPCGIG